MPKLPRLSGLKVIKVLKKIGFEPVRQKGSHIILIRIKDGKKEAIVVPNHREIDKRTLLEIIRQARLKREEFLEFL